MSKEFKRWSADTTIAAMLAGAMLGLALGPQVGVETVDKTLHAVADQFSDAGEYVESDPSRSRITWGLTGGVFGSMGAALVSAREPRPSDTQKKSKK